MHGMRRPHQEKRGPFVVLVNRVEHLVGKQVILVDAPVLRVVRAPGRVDRVLGPGFFAGPQVEDLDLIAAGRVRRFVRRLVGRFLVVVQLPTRAGIRVCVCVVRGPPRVATAVVVPVANAATATAAAAVDAVVVVQLVVTAVTVVRVPVVVRVVVVHQRRAVPPPLGRVVERRHAGVPLPHVMCAVPRVLQLRPDARHVARYARGARVGVVEVVRRRPGIHHVHVDGVPTRLQRRPRRRTVVVHVKLVQDHTNLRQRVDVGGDVLFPAHVVHAAEPHVAVTPVVHQQHDQVRLYDRVGRLLGRFVRRHVRRLVRRLLCFVVFHVAAVLLVLVPLHHRVLIRRSGSGFFLPWVSGVCER